MTEKELPKVVKESVAKNFSDWEIEEVAKIVSKNKTSFEVELEKDEQKIDTIFSAEGKLLKKIEKAEEKENSDKADTKEDSEDLEK